MELTTTAAPTRRKRLLRGLLGGGLLGLAAGGTPGAILFLKTGSLPEFLVLSLGGTAALAVAGILFGLLAPCSLKPMQFPLWVSWAVIPPIWREVGTRLAGPDAGLIGGVIGIGFGVVIVLSFTGMIGFLKEWRRRQALVVRQADRVRPAQDAFEYFPGYVRQQDELAPAFAEQG